MLLSANIFQPLMDVFESVLKFFHDSVGVPWGWSIVLLTVVVRAVLIPLTVKQFGSMQRMQQLKPEMKAIQAKYKEDKERQQQEMMRFYKENKVNPLGSCLPLVAQLPVFISLFYMLRTTLRLDICPGHQPRLANGLINTAHLRPCGAGHGAGFLFISDLTNKATGLTLIVLLALYVGSQLASSLMMSSATMDRNQRMIMLVMPLFFVFIFLQYPAGLLVYWITTNLWTIAQQFVVKRRIGPARAPVVATAGGATSVVATGRSSPKAPPKSEPEPGSEPPGNGAGSASGGLGSLLRGLGRSESEKSVVAAKPAGPPPRPPRKKKKRSGRRR
jgi:YidC/Oxa1 family membrane protein insertase